VPPRTVGEVGEIDLVARIVEILAEGVPLSDAVKVGPGDDAAVVRCDGDVVLTSDSQHEDVHFRRAWIGARQLGRRAIAVNASDLGAMGSSPIGFLVALALPPDTELGWVEELAAGLREGAQRYGASVVGGDVAAVRERIAINVTAVGERHPDVTAGRDGARAGQRLFVSGWPGRAAAGLRLLQAGAPVSGAEAETCVRALLDPMPPVAFATAVAGRGLVGAMMDISDGVALDLGRLCRASRVGAQLDGSALIDDPLLASAAAGLGASPRELVLGGGEDYGLLCAVREGAEDEFHRLAEEHAVIVRAVGEVVAGDGITLSVDGRAEPLAASGWDHFA
jgi:thiamine-monophosphate kinase